MPSCCAPAPTRRSLELDRHAGVPVINGLTYEHHPCQALADAQTLRERFGDLAGLRVAYLGDGNNCCVSLMIVGALTGMRVTRGLPRGLSRPIPRSSPGPTARRARAAARARVTADPGAAVEGARALYTDTWVSMGDEGDEHERRALFTPYRIDDALLARAAPATRSCSTACPRTTARRSPARCCTGPARRCGTRPRTACTCRRRCSRTRSP